MATTPGGFFQDTGAVEGVSYALKNLPNGFKGFTNTLEGTAGADRFVGTKGNDIFVLGAGDKITRDAGGYDAVKTDQSFNIGGTKVETVMLTGNTNANVTGDKYDNNLFGNDGNNALKGGSGTDVVAGGAGNDRVYGGNDNDTVLGGSGDDRVYGDNGNDIVKGGTGNDKVYGGSGNDKVYGEDGADTVYGGSGNDRVSGGADNDRLYGDSGNDKLFGGTGDDILIGGSGNDTLVGDKGSNTFIGGSGNDTFDIAGQTGEIDTIRDFRAGDDIIDLSDTSANSLRDLKFTADQDGTIVTVKGGVTIKLVGYDPDDIDGSFFNF
jgi:Ca2+-binding RTX toxin-like protein